MEQNCEHAKTNTDLSGAYNILKVDNKTLQLMIQKLQARFRDKEDSLLLKKTRVVYSMRRKTLENAKNGISNIDDYISEILTLETTAFQNILARPTTSSSLGACSKSSGFEGEGKDVASNTE